MYKVEVLQHDGSWCCFDSSHRRRAVAEAEAEAITAKHYTACRTVNGAGEVVSHCLPEFPQVAYPGAWGVQAREAIAAIVGAQ